MAALNAARFALGVHEIAPPERHGATVNVNVGVQAGCVLDLREPDDLLPRPAGRPVLIEREALPAPAGERSD